MLTGRYVKYIFPAATGTEVCQSQDAGPGRLILNGDLSDNLESFVSFVNNGYCRTLSLSSPDDLSAANFTISGMQNGVPVTEVLSGPNNNTVYGVTLYDIVTLITVDRLVGNIQVGSGTAGFFNPIAIDQSMSPIGYNLAVNYGQTDIPVHAPEYTVYGTLDTVTFNGFTASENINNATYFVLDEGQQANIMFPDISTLGAPYSPYIPILSYLLVLVGSNELGLEFTSTLTFRQMGG